MGCGASQAVAHRRGMAMLTSGSQVVITRSMIAYMPAAVSLLYLKRTKEPTMPLVETFPGAVLFADVSGFSYLLEQLSQHRDTAGGPERLTYLMNGFLGELVDTIVLSGGDIVQFAGDAFLAVWKATTKSTLGDTTLRVVQCATSVQTLISQSKVSNGAQAVALSMRIEIGAGLLTAIHFGTPGRRAYVVVGPEVDNAYIADKHNEPGNIVLTKEAYESLQPKQAFAAKLPHIDAYKFIQLRSPINASPSASPSPSPSPSYADSLYSSFDTALPNDALLSPYLPNHVLELLRAKHSDWLAEVRNVTTVFALLPKSSFPTTDKQYGTFMQANLTDIVESVVRYDGTLAHLSADDKGIFCVIVLGIPSHENDAMRGVSTAVEIVRRFNLRKVVSQIGVATGVAVSCSVGSKQRCQYTLYGATVNLAARLMVASHTCAVPILCDETTSLEAKSRFFFRPLEPMTLKGFANKVTAFTPEFHMNWTIKTTYVETANSNATSKRKLVGRTDEINHFISAKQNLLDSRKSSCMIIESEIGQGRATLIANLSTQALENGFCVLYGEADSIDITPFNAFKNVLIGLFAFETNQSAEARRDKVANKIPSQYLPYLALLNVILPMNFPDSDKSSLLKGPARIDMLKKMILALLQQSALHQPTLLILQDIQWLDSASWAALQSAVHTVHPLLVLVGTRTIPNPTPQCYLKLQALGAQLFTLGPLSDSENAEVISDRLGLQGCPDDLMNFVKEVTAGNLLFMMELLSRIKQEEGVLTVDSAGVTKFNGFINTVSSNGTLSRNMQLLLAAKIDSLEPDAQLLIRVASVIGRVFKWDAAVGIFPVATRKLKLLEELSRLEEADLITNIDDRDAALQSKVPIQFKSALIQQIVYNSMVSKQREQLHSSAAEWYISEYSTRPDAGAYYATILHHYEKANNLSLSLHYALKSAEYAASIAALTESLLFYKKALDNPAISELSQHKQAKIRIAMFDICLATARIEEAAKLLGTALVDLGCQDPVEASSKATQAELVEEFFKIHSATPQIVPEDDYPMRERLLEILSLYCRVLMCYGFLRIKDLTKICVYTTAEMGRIQMATGYSDCFAGITFAQSIALNMAEEYDESDKFYLQARKILAQTTEREFPQQLRGAFIATKARTHIYSLLGLLAHAAFKEVHSYWERALPQLRAANDMRGIIAINSNYAGSLMFQGRFADAQAICCENNKIASEIGDVTQYGLLFPLFEAFALIRLGNAPEAHLKLLYVEAVMRANQAAIEHRITIFAAAIRGLCYLQRKEFALAHAAIQPIETLMYELEASTPIFMIAFVAFMDVVCELSLEHRYTSHKQAMALWYKMQPRYEAQCNRFLVGKGSILMRAAQLSRATSENMGGDQADINKRFIQSLEDALVQTCHLDVCYDHGLIHTLLAKAYDKTNILAFEHYNQASSLLQSTGAMWHYIELKQYWIDRGWHHSGNVNHSLNITGSMHLTSSNGKRSNLSSSHSKGVY